MEIHVRRACAFDVPAIDALGTKSYPANYFEGHEAFASKILNNPDTCWVVTVDGYVVGYIIAFPYVVGLSYPIRETYTPVEAPDCLYIHDLCVNTLFRGLKLGQKLVEKVLEHNAFQTFALTAVLDSHQFWGRFGFTTAHTVNYCGLTARYMTLKR